jgi:hypothetical protein
MYTFEAGKGVNVEKLNANFTESKNAANTNESKLLELSNKALKKDGSNLTQDIVTKFQQEEPVVLTNKSGNISLTDNKTHFLSLSGAGKIVLPTVNQDSFSHTITLIVDSSSYSLDLGTQKHLYNPLNIDTTKCYSVVYIYNKIDKSWYFSLTQ